MSSQPARIFGDTDSLISLALSNQRTHQRVHDTTEKLLENLKVVYFPFPILMETAVTLSRKFNDKVKARLLVKQFLSGVFNVIYPTEEVCKRAARIYVEKSTSKKNTLFDALVAACAEDLGAEAILSLDEWYQKLGFKLAEDLFRPN